MSKMTQPKVAFLIITWNNQPIIAECLDSIKKQTYTNHETYVIDNSSSDGTADFVASNYPDVKLIENSENTGFAKANNQGIAAIMENSDAEHIVLLNSDAQADPKWLGNILDYIKNKPQTAMVQGLTLDYYNHSIVDSTNIYVNHLGQAIQAGYSQPLRINELRSKKVFGVNAAACLITRAFIEANPFKHVFDESFFMYLEDVDLAFRINLLGWNNYFCRDAVAYHMGSYSSKGLANGYSLYMTYRNNTPMLFKNLPTLDLAKVMVRAILVDRRVVKAMKLGGNAELSGRLIRGRLDGILRAPRYVFKRAKLYTRRRISKEYLRYLMTNPD